MKLQPHFTVGHWHGAPIRLHWTVLLAALVFGQMRFAPGVWMGILFLIFLHELGHATLVRHYGLRLHDIWIHGLGGACRWSGRATRFQDSVIAWGGILAQSLALAVTLLAVAVFGRPTSPFFAELTWAFTVSNLWIAGFNLLPFGPLDGAKAWPLIGLLYRRWQRRRLPPVAVRVVREGSGQADWLAGMEAPPKKIREAGKILEDLARQVAKERQER